MQEIAAIEELSHDTAFADATNRVSIIQYRQLRKTMCVHQLQCIRYFIIGMDRDQLRGMMGFHFDDQTQRHSLDTKQALLFHPFIREKLREIAFTGIANDKNDNIVLSQVLSDLQSCPCNS